MHLSTLQKFLSRFKRKKKTPVRDPELTRYIIRNSGKFDMDKPTIIHFKGKYYKIRVLG